MEFVLCFVYTGQSYFYGCKFCRTDTRPLTVKMMSESRVTWATSVPIVVFLGLSVLDLGLMYATDRQTSDSVIA